MRNGMLRLREEFPNDWYSISSELGKAIVFDNQNALSQIISKHFSKDETADFLNGAIAAYDDGEGVKFKSPAVWAVMGNNKEGMELILKATNNPNAHLNPDDADNTQTLLIYAVMLAKFEMVELLLKSGANPNEEFFNTEEDGKKTNHGDALSWAVRNGLTKTADLLLDYGAIPSQESAIAAIKSSGELDPYLVKIIKLRPELLQCQIDGVTLPHMAALKGSLPAIKWLLEQGCNVNAKDVNGMTPTDWAKNKEVTEFFRSIGGVSGVLNNSHPTVPNATLGKLEITNIVERLELLEDKLGIIISSLYASCESRPHVSPPDHVVRINFDVNSAAGGELERSLKINASTYNTLGQLLSTEKAYITKENFIGFESKEMIFFVDQAPTKIRLFPTAND